MEGYFSLHSSFFPVPRQVCVHREHPLNIHTCQRPSPRFLHRTSLSDEGLSWNRFHPVMVDWISKSFSLILSSEQSSQVLLVFQLRIWKEESSLTWVSAVQARETDVVFNSISREVNPFSIFFWGAVKTTSTNINTHIQVPHSTLVEYEYIAGVWCSDCLDSSSMR